MAFAALSLARRRSSGVIFKNIATSVLSTPAAGSFRAVSMIRFLAFPAAGCKYQFARLPCYRGRVNR
jgi:hypothetical protein